MPSTHPPASRTSAAFGRAFGKAMAATSGDARVVNTILRIAWDEWLDEARAEERERVVAELRGFFAAQMTNPDAQWCSREEIEAALEEVSGLSGDKESGR